MVESQLRELDAFVVGEVYTNDQIRLSLNVENLGGIRPALDRQRNVRHIAIITAEKDSGKLFSENPYRDRVEGDVLVFTAQGRVGDQSLSGRNKRLLEQYAAPVPFLGFTNVGRQSYRFLGMLELLRHYQERQIDRSCGLRLAWIFEFRIHPEPAVVPISAARQVMATIIATSKYEADEPSNSSDASQPEHAGTDDGPAAARHETIRSQLLQLSPNGFERFLQGMMTRAGFKDVNVTGKSGDGGIDLHAVADDSNYFFAGTHVQVQAKRWRHAVSNVEVNGFRGAVSPQAKGVFVTTGSFTVAACREAVHPSKPTITLMDGMRLARLIDTLQISVA